MTIRLLFIGFKEKDIPIISENLDIFYEVRKWTELPTLHDYDVILSDLHNLLDSDILEAGSYKSMFKEQVQTGGLLIIFSAPNATYYGSGYKPYHRYHWIPNMESIASVEEPGESVSVLESDFESLFKAVREEDISWELYFKPTDVCKPLVTNRAGHPISLEMSLGKGKVVLLPLFSDRAEAIRNIVEKTLPGIYPNLEKASVKHERKVARPGWVEKHIFVKKQELMKKVESNNKDIQKYTQLEALIYSKDIELVQSVALALKELGFDVAVTAEEGTVADLEIRLDEGYNSIAEVKGLISPVKIQHLRQLLHYFIDKRDVEQVEGIKAIFFVNHQRNRKPENRDKVPYTPTALEAAQKHGIAIVSTYDLFETMRRVVHGEVPKEEVRKKIVDGIGYVNFVS